MGNNAGQEKPAASVFPSTPVLPVCLSLCTPPWRRSQRWKTHRLPRRAASLIQSRCNCSRADHHARAAAMRRGAPRSPDIAFERLSCAERGTAASIDGLLRAILSPRPCTQVFGTVPQDTPVRRSARVRLRRLGRRGDVAGQDLRHGAGRRPTQGAPGRSPQQHYSHSAAGFKRQMLR